MSSSNPIDILSRLMDLFYPVGLILVGIVLVALRRKYITKKSALATTVSLLIYWMFFGAAYFITYSSAPDATLMKFYLIMGVIGALPVLLQLYFLGLTFLAGSAVGWLLGCIISANMNPLEPNMSAGFANMIALVIGAVLAVILEIAYQLVKRRSCARGV